MSKDTNGANGSGWKNSLLALAGFITAVTALITAGTGLLNALKSPENAVSESTQPTQPAPKSDVETNNKITESVKEVGKEIILVDTTGDIDLPDTSRSLSMSYICEELEDETFRTVAQTPSKEVALINWSRYVGDNWSPSARCEEVTNRFQNAHSLGRLGILTTGRMNGQNVICAADRSGDCDRDLDENGLLYTITSDVSPGDALLNLLNLGLAKDVPPINESAGDRIYINLQELIQLSDSEECFLGCQN